MSPLPLAIAGLPGGLEWIVIGLVALLLFGKRLPGAARAIGQTLQAFRSGLAGTGEETTEDVPDSHDGKPS